MGGCLFLCTGGCWEENIFACWPMERSCVTVSKISSFHIIIEIIVLMLSCLTFCKRAYLEFLLSSLRMRQLLEGEYRENRKADWNAELQHCRTGYSLTLFFQDKAYPRHGSQFLYCQDQSWICDSLTQTSHCTDIFMHTLTSWVQPE